MPDNKQELHRRLQEAESTLEALSNGQVDAIVGKHGVSLVRFREIEKRLRETEENLRKTNHELERRVAERTNKARLLALRLADAQEEERQRIATGLHDEVCQLVAAGQLKLEEARECGDKRDRNRMLDNADLLLMKAGDEIRSLTFELSSSSLFKAGFMPAARELCTHMTKRHGVRFEINGVRDDIRVPESIRPTLYQCLRELLFNVVKHAGVDTAMVRIENDGNRLRITVRDRGKGFDAACLDSSLTRKGGFGLHHIRERIYHNGGKLLIESTPGDGTTAVVEIVIR